MKEEKDPRFFNYLFGFEKIHTRLQLLAVTGVHVLVWIVFFSVPLIFFPLRISDSNFYLKEIVNKLFLIAFFYANYFYFIPRYFIPKKYAAYVLLLLLSLCLLIAQHVMVERYWLPNNGMPGMIGARPPWTQGSEARFFMGRHFSHRSVEMPLPPAFFEHERNYFGLKNVLLMTTSRVFFSFLLLILIGGFIRLLQQFIKTQNEKKGLENASLQAEISLLKSRINPHFLFNTLNSIYALASQKSDNTEKSILKLSEILRYMIYDTTAEVIPLVKDIHSISSYIDLQRLRLPSKIVIDYSVNGTIAGLSITPLLLITFIENAFKHGISYTQASHIKISIGVVDKTLTLYVTNPVVPGLTFEKNGIGLKNARRRLDLLYPGRYSLEITESKSLYVVDLKINLAANELPDHR